MNRDMITDFTGDAVRSARQKVQEAEACLAGSGQLREEYDFSQGRKNLYNRIHWYSNDSYLLRVSQRKADLGMMVPVFSQTDLCPLLFRMDGFPVWFTCWESWLGVMNHKRVQDAVRLFGRMAGASLMEIKRLWLDDGMPSEYRVVVYGLGTGDPVSWRGFLCSHRQYCGMLDETHRFPCRLETYLFDVGGSRLFHSVNGQDGVFARKEIRSFFAGFAE